MIRSMKRQTRDTIRWAIDDDGFLTLSPHHLPGLRGRIFTGSDLFKILVLIKN